MAPSVRFDHGGREYELRPARPPWPARSALARPLPDGFDRIDCIEAWMSPSSAAPRWLQRVDARRLRALAEDADSGPGVLRDAQVHGAVARLLRQGRLRLFELARRGPADDQHVECARECSLAVTPSMLRAAPAAVAAPPSPAHAAARAPVIDQDRQAAVLRRAAELGTPFCEECARQRAADALEAA